MNGIIAWMARNGVAANLLMVFMLVAGATSFFQITVKLFPGSQSRPDHYSGGLSRRLPH